MFDVLRQIKNVYHTAFLMVFITSSNNQKIYNNIIKYLFTQNKIIVFGSNFTFTLLIKHTKITTRDLYLIFQQKKVFFSLQLMPILFDKILNLTNNDNFRTAYIKEHCEFEEVLSGFLVRFL